MEKRRSTRLVWRKEEKSTGSSLLGGKMRERQGEVKGIECLKGREEDEESECFEENGRRERTCSKKKQEEESKGSVWRKKNDRKSN